MRGHLQSGIKAELETNFRSCSSSRGTSHLTWTWIYTSCRSFWWPKANASYWSVPADFASIAPARAPVPPTPSTHISCSSGQCFLAKVRQFFGRQLTSRCWQGAAKAWPDPQGSCTLRQGPLPPATLVALARDAWPLLDRSASNCVTATENSKVDQ